MLSCLRIGSSVSRLSILQRCVRQSNLLQTNHRIINNTAARYLSTRLPNNDRDELEEKDKSKKGLIMKYGAVGVGTYFGVYVCTLGSIYCLVFNGFIVSGDVTSIINYLSLDQYITIPSLSKSANDFAVAWVLTKLTEPIRFAVTVMITPSVARLLGKKIDERNEKIKRGEIKGYQYDINNLKFPAERTVRMRAWFNRMKERTIKVKKNVQ